MRRVLQALSWLPPPEFWGVLVEVGVESSCNARKKNVRCFGALGGTVNLRIMDKASQLTKFIWAKKRSELFRWITHKIVARTKDNRFSFFPNNGTVRITNLRKHDSGEYRLVMFKKGRKHKGTRKLKLFIEAPVSSVRLVSKCTSSGKQRVICFPKAGDNHSCKWTMNKKPLKKTKTFSGNGASCTILLKPKTKGRLVCSIKNHISHSFKEMKITTCEKDGAKKPNIPPKLFPKEKDEAKKPKVPKKLPPKKKEVSNKPRVPPKLSPKGKDGAKKPTVPPKVSPKENDGAKKPTFPPKLSPKEKDGAKKPTVPPKLHHHVLRPQPPHLFLSVCDKHLQK
ncbi:hypothetical protein CCH79_00017183 [Gambusia affinis]|uniref:Immunoglobulin V-set domain-containing protein n=1 Tax=Gambusia affinis TaxID=33528 RepID=A0A315VBI2_GAMAF|nr:hypothetical protein CCH79_00017183 [Gambusia affinis]